MLIVGCSAKAVRLYGSDRKWNQMTADTNCDSQTIRLNYPNSAPSTTTLYCSVTVQIALSKCSCAMNNILI